ncbi:hypothetical protein HYDPIDRAFT_113147 [Hydnomerulius pinastri MD-312]|uniref:C-CAP/cofactor C-like domain-containing protein n=1 Tax=Hydnomerulius pinastri MD-312 TaxID=994086 RepID=A0A0C9W896_9AGAM|nr:hypothetical protein HYDPIDRAFT_113147 [Hydnomerulius pinastri MD-312]
MSQPKWTFAQNFCTEFNVTASELASRLENLKSSSVASPESVQAVASDLSRLTKSLSDATGSLPSYDQRQCELQLKALEKTVEELRGVFTSTSKFSFKRKTAKAKEPVELASTAALVSEQVPPPSISSTKTLSSFSHRYLTMANLDDRTTSAEVSISDLDNCIVNLLPQGNDGTEISAFHVQRVSRCIFLFPPIAGSIILHDLTQCVIVTGCHQFRMHNSTAVDIYLAIESNPVIEHCSKIRFAAYPSSLLRSATQQDSKHLSVQDFSHIRSTPSPNWTALSEEKGERLWPVSELEDQALREHLHGILPAREGGPEGAS